MKLSTFGDVNYLAVLVGGIAQMVVGYLWFSPMLFGKTWARLSGIQMGGANTGSAAVYALPAIGYLLTSAALAFLARSAGASTVGDGIVLGLVVSIGISLVAVVISLAFQGKPLSLGLLTAGNAIVGVTLAAIIVTAWD